MKKSKNALVSILGKFYYLFLEFHFFYRMYSLGRGNIYIDTGEPILVKANASKNELARCVQEEAARCYRVTMPALVSYAISKGATARSELKKCLEGYASILKKGHANFQPLFELEESIDSALHDLAQRKIISGGDPFLVKKPEVVTYYSNTIAHHLEPAVDELTDVK